MLKFQTLFSPPHITHLIETRSHTHILDSNLKEEMSMESEFTFLGRPPSMRSFLVDSDSTMPQQILKYEILLWTRYVLVIT